MRFLVIALTLTVSTGVFALDGNYLCIPDKSTGFILKDDVWSQANFNVDNKKYMIKKIDEETKKEYEKDGIPYGEYGVYIFGEKYPEFRNCEYTVSDASIVNPKGERQFYCDGIFRGKFILNLNNNRFLTTFPLGYWGEEFISGDEDTRTPYIEIGLCSKL